MSGDELWKLDKSNGNFIASVPISNACSTIPNYSGQDYVLNFKYALNRIVLMQSIYTDTFTVHRACIQTYNSSDLSLEFVYIDQLPYLNNQPISLDVDKTNGDVYFFEWANLNTPMVNAILMLSKYNRDGVFIYNTSYFDNNTDVYFPNINEPKPSTTIVNGVMYFLGKYFDSTLTSFYRFVFVLNMSNGSVTNFKNVLALSSGPSNDICTSPMLVNNTIFYGQSDVNFMTPNVLLNISLV